MSRAIVVRAFAVAVLASLLLTLSDSRGDAPPQKSKSAKAPAAAKSGGKSESLSKSKREKAAVSEAARSEAKIEAELDEPIDMEYQDTPLKDIVDSISSRLGITIVLDNKALADASITPDTTFTKTIRGIPLRSAMHLLLADHDLNFYVDNDVLLITTNDIAKAHTVVRVYDVNAFAETAESLDWERRITPPTVGGAFQVAAEPVNAVKQNPAQASNKAASTTNPQRNRNSLSRASGRSSASGFGGGTEQPQRPPLRPGEIDYDALQKLLTGTLEPTTWDENGGTGSISFFGDKMIVSQTEVMQRQIGDLLEALKPQSPPVPLSLSGPPVMSRYEAKIEDALDHPIDMEYQDTPLKDIVDSLSDRLGISIVLDNKALADASVTPDTTFTKTLRGISLRQALHLLLADHDLSFFDYEDVLLITTNDIAKAHTHIVIYPVDDLIGTAGVVGHDDYDQLIETIVGTVAPTTWDSNGGVGSIAPFVRSKLLVLSQTQEVQNEVKSLLTKLAVSKPPAPKAAAAKPAPVQPAANVNGFELHSYDASSWAGSDNALKAAPQFAELVKKLIEPKSWNQPDAFVGVSGQLVVIRQTVAVHRQIQKLVDVMASAANPPQQMGGMGGGMGGGFGGGFSGPPTH